MKGNESRTRSRSNYEMLIQGSVSLCAIHVSIKVFSASVRVSTAGNVETGQGMLNDLLAALRKEQLKDPLTEEQVKRIIP